MKHLSLQLGDYTESKRQHLVYSLGRAGRSQGRFYLGNCFGALERWTSS